VLDELDRLSRPKLTILEKMDRARAQMAAELARGGAVTALATGLTWRELVEAMVAAFISGRSWEGMVAAHRGFLPEGAELLRELERASEESGCSLDLLVAGAERAGLVKLSAPPEGAKYVPARQPTRPDGTRGFHHSRKTAMAAAPVSTLSAASAPPGLAQQKASNARKERRAAQFGPPAAAKLDSSNVGYEMMRMMGWKQGGLGKDGTGRVEPISSTGEGREEPRKERKAMDELVDQMAKQKVDSGPFSDDYTAEASNATTTTATPPPPPPPSAAATVASSSEQRSSEPIESWEHLIETLPELTARLRGAEDTLASKIDQIVASKDRERISRFLAALDALMLL
jgi:hypothetical protein